MLNSYLKIAKIFRCVNITRSDEWLELDQENTRKKTAAVTWALSLTTYITLIPYIQLTFKRYDTVNPTWAYLFLSGLAGSIFIASVFYAKIYIFAKKSAQPNLKSSEETFAVTNDPPSNTKGPKGIPQINYINNFGEDSDDEDLIDTPESPSVKQTAAVSMALRTMILVSILPIICIVILYFYCDSLWAYAFVACLLAFLRCPGIICICTFNFGPIRNQVEMYIEDLPEHIKDSFVALEDYFIGLFSSDSDSDETNIVEATDDMERATHSPPIRKQRLNIVGKRESAVSPTNSIVEKLPQVQC